MKSCNRLQLGAALLAVSVATAATAGGPLKSTALVYESASSENGYLNATIDLKYRFIACAGEVHLAYSLVPNSVKASSSYRYNGAVVEASVPAPKPSSVGLTGRAFRNGVTLGTISDGFAAQSLGMGCFDGQSQQVGLVKDLIPTAKTPEQVDAYLAGLDAAFDPLPVLTNSSLENLQREQLAAKEAAKKKAEREALAERERAEQRRLAAAAKEAQQQEAAKSASAGSAQAAAEASQVAANAEQQRKADLERQGQIARQELRDRQQREVDEGNARAEETRRQQQVAGEALSQVAASVGAAWDAAEDRAAQRKHTAQFGFQAAIRNRCVDREDETQWARRQINFGQEISDQLTKTDCAEDTWWPVDNYGFDLDKPTRVRVSTWASGKPQFLNIDKWGAPGGENGPWIFADQMSGGMFGNKHLQFEGVLPAGKYRIRVMSYYGMQYDGDVSSSYRIKLENLSPPSAEPSAALPIEVTPVVVAAPAPVAQEVVSTPLQAVEEVTDTSSTDVRVTKAVEQRTEPLANSATEADKKERVRQQTEEALEASNANWQKVKAESDAQLAARKALEEQLARLAVEAKIKHEQNVRAQQEYEEKERLRVEGNARRLQQYREDYKKAHGRYPDQ